MIETVKEKSRSKKNIGSSCDEFLSENATLNEATAVAVKRVIAWRIEEEMKAQSLNKTEMAKRMHTSRAALNRLLDENDTSLTLTTLVSEGGVLGKTLKVEGCRLRNKFEAESLSSSYF